MVSFLYIRPRGVERVAVEHRLNDKAINQSHRRPGSLGDILVFFTNSLSPDSDDQCINYQYIIPLRYHDYRRRFIDF